eukprot:365159-Chlamydomonas_euryale.AAC.14
MQPAARAAASLAAGVWPIGHPCMQPAARAAASLAAGVWPIGHPCMQPAARAAALPLLAPQARRSVACAQRAAASLAYRAQHRGCSLHSTGTRGTPLCAGRTAKHKAQPSPAHHRTAKYGTA